jgi:hypothetical protein
VNLRSVIWYDREEREIFSPVLCQCSPGFVLFKLGYIQHIIRKEISQRTIITPSKTDLDKHLFFLLLYVFSGVYKSSSTDFCQYKYMGFFPKKFNRYTV